MEDRKTICDTDHKRELCELCLLPNNTHLIGGTLKIKKKMKQKNYQKFVKMEFYGTTTILDRNYYFCSEGQPRKTEKYERNFKNRSYKNYDEEAYSRTPYLYITREVFEEIKTDVKKT